MRDVKRAARCTFTRAIRAERREVQREISLRAANNIRWLEDLDFSSIPVTPFDGGSR
jgi:hypothetical protein